ncbi:MAG: N-acetylglucosamine-6-phosphate deacetylase [Symploca sp. SIO1C4]|uniref:N-acetylglucosamine-6-phosphate deacetylase n=1 Tax=Symploca sp. SIO1C4 TaxID=2607765 RepID=A0A6B3N7Q7_9CYAN|nr:N-acetylglucosamine-6-phosphate deacetylase [Symploca sp. SIO1C4]
MGVNLEIIKARLPGYQGLQCLKIDEFGRIRAIAPMEVGAIQDNSTLYGDEEESRLNINQLTTIDVAGDWVSLGGVDLQINGALGLAFTDVEREDIECLHEICQFLWRQGIDAFVPTLVTTSTQKIKRSLSVFADFVTTQAQEQAAAKILGVHLEGPFLNQQKRGAHPAEYLLPLTVENVKLVLGDYADVVKVMTLAPELDVTGEAIAYLRSLGIIISLGHSLATAAQAESAFALGASMVTHAFNAMPVLHHREPGLLGAALLDPAVKCGMIADGQHVCPIMMQLLLRAGGYEQGVFLVSDALAPIGLPEGIYPWDTRQIEVKNGTARLLDGTLSGTTLPLLVGVENLVRWGICGAESAIALATEAPREAIGLPGIRVGQAANLLRWHVDEVTSKLSGKRLKF